MLESPETRPSFVKRLANSADQEVWSEFAEIYRPIIIRVAISKGLQHVDAEDLAQDVMTTVSRAVESFEARPGCSFRGWLYRITCNLCVNFFTRGPGSRKRGFQGLGDSEIRRLLEQRSVDEPTVTLFEAEHRRILFRRAAQNLQSRFRHSTWQCFWLTAVEGKSIQAVAKELGLSEGAVRVARCRVLAKLKDTVEQEEK